MNPNRGVPRTALLSRKANVLLALLVSLVRFLSRLLQTARASRAAQLSEAEHVPETLEGRVALREGALIAKQCNANVVLLAVVDPAAQMSVVADASIAYVPRYQTEEFQKILDEGVARLTRLGLAHSALLRVGDPVTCIVEVAKQVGSDLVVIGHHRQGVLARWLIGSVAASLVDRLDCSLLMGRLEVTEEELFPTTGGWRKPA